MAEGGEREVAGRSEVISSKEGKETLDDKWWGEGDSFIHSLSDG